jgi:hypothetical protein
VIIETQALSRARIRHVDESLTSNIGGRKMSPKTLVFILVIVI